MGDGDEVEEVLSCSKAETRQSWLWIYLGERAGAVDESG